MAYDKLTMVENTSQSEKDRKETGEFQDKVTTHIDSEYFPNAELYAWNSS